MREKKIVLVEREKVTAHFLKLFFRDCSNVEVVNGDIRDALKERMHSNQALVAPGNAFGIMDGGMDLAIREIVGLGAQHDVQSVIHEEYRGELIVGTSISVPVEIPGVSRWYLIYTPTMRIPSVIRDPEIVYQATRSALLCAQRLRVEEIILPAFGAGVGKVNPLDVADQMRKGFEQMYLHENADDWEQVEVILSKLHER